MTSNSQNIQEVFACFAKDYDKQNNLFSLYLHKLWKKKLVKLCTLTKLQSQKGQILDIAAGTLDISLELCKKYPDSKIYALDICPEMLDYGLTKATAKEKEQINCLVADACQLDFPDQSMSLVTISFGIRNINPRTLALQEIFRVLEDKGQLCILEFAPLELPIIKNIYNFYLSKIMPFIAGLISKSTDSYTYFAQSIKDFPVAKDFQQELKAIGFENVQYKKLLFGIAVIYIAQKPSI